FRDNVIHLVAENYQFFGRVAGENLGNPAQNLKRRDELIKALRESYDYGAKVWAGLTEEKALEMIEVRDQKVQRWSAILGAIQDNMNHYGNLVVYVRLNGLVPPRSAGRSLKATLPSGGWRARPPHALAGRPWRERPAGLPRLRAGDRARRRCRPPPAAPRHRRAR